MPTQDIYSRDIRKHLGFRIFRDCLMLHTPNGVYRLSVAAAEDLMVNFEINLESLQRMVDR
jgi:hypothetical protein